MNKTLPIGYSIRLAVVRSVHATSVTCIYMDKLGEQSVDCPVPQPFAGVGTGIFAGIQPDTRVLIAQAPHEQSYIVAVVPDRGLYFGDLPNRPFSTPSYPELEMGEICVQGPKGSYIQFFKDGSLALDAGLGDKTSDIELSRVAHALFVRTDNIYNFSEAGREIEGVVFRDKNEEEKLEDTKALDFLSGENYRTLLSTIGRSPGEETSLRTSKISKDSVRNPALVEKRSITYEYANSFGVRGLPLEAVAMVQVKEQTINSDINNIGLDASSREQRRTDVLNLNPRNFNHLIEKVEGTVVDIYGNVLDINRNIIPVPDLSQIKTSDDVESKAGLRRVYNYLRRSIKYHMEMNSRKELSSIAPSINVPGYNAKDHSRWSIDVDGEGLTKINIPASSETGNIPVLGRYVVSRDQNADEDSDSGAFKPEDKKDVKVLQFGAKSGDNFAGAVIDNSTYAPEHVPLDSNTPGRITAGTAYHDIFNIASSILSFGGGKLRDPEASGGEFKPSMTNSLNNGIPELEQNSSGKDSFNPDANEDANAGGRSLHANLDGSIEMSIGADTADRKSMLLDLAGGVISHYGRDRNGRSIIHQSDGDIIIQVGGTGISDDPRFSETSDTEDRPGRVEIHLNRPGGNSQKIIIDEEGITLDINGNGVLKTSGDLSISAGGKLLLNGSHIWAYGSFDSSVDGDRSIRGVGGEREVGRKGRKI